MSEQQKAIQYIEGMISYLSNRTKGLEAEFNALLSALRIRKVKWVGKPLGSSSNDKEKSATRRKSVQRKKSVQEQPKREVGLPEHKVNVKL